MNVVSPRGDVTGQPAEHAYLGWWRPDDSLPSLTGKSVKESLRMVRRPLYLVERNGSVVPETGGTGLLGAGPAEGFPLRGYVPPCPPEQLGNLDFCSELGLRFPYLGGSMAKGISSAAMVEELGRAGMLGFFGAAGLPLAMVEAAIERLAGSGLPYGVNLIHSPQELDLEHALADLYIRKRVRLIEASAFLSLTLSLIRYRVHGIHRGADGTIVTPNRIIAKVSREELAIKFFGI